MNSIERLAEASALLRTVEQSQELTVAQRDACTHIRGLVDVLASSIETLQEMEGEPLRTDDRHAEDFLEGSVDQPDPDVQEYDDQDDQGTDPTSAYPDKAGPVESSTKDTVEPQGTDTQNRSARPSTGGKTGHTALAKGEDPFAGELPNVDDQYVMNLGGDAYIRRARYARIAKSCGYRLDDLDEVVGAHETDWKHSKYRATIVDEGGNVVGEDVGSAHADAEDLQDAEAHLDELAATRAVTRALAWATGEGLTAVAEVAEDRTERIE